MIHHSDLKIVFDRDGNPIKGEIVFSHVDDYGELRYFAIERMVTEIERGRLAPPIIEVPIDYTFAYYAQLHRGIEQHRLARITPADIAHYPVMFAHMPGNARDTPDEHLLIDGHHRYVKAAGLGWKTLRGYALSQEMWEPFLIEPPEELVESERQRIANQHINPIDSRIK